MGSTTNVEAAEELEKQNCHNEHAPPPCYKGREVKCVYYTPQYHSFSFS